MEGPNGARETHYARGRAAAPIGRADAAQWNEIMGPGIKHPSIPRRNLDKLLPKLGRTAAAEVTAADIAA
jgi:hypothetical protein